MDLFTTHPITYDIYNSEASKQRNFSKGQNYLNVGHGVWFGNNSVVLSGCKTIGNGAVIGAGSVVTKDIPDNVVGVFVNPITGELVTDTSSDIKRKMFYLLQFY